MPIVSRSNAFRWLSKLGLTMVLALLLAITLSAQTRPAEPRLQGSGTLKVMTYNMDVGADYAGMLDRDYNTFLQAATKMVTDIRASDPAGRTQAIAREIVATMPHLVSLQEVATMSTGPTKDNLTLEFDYLQLLLQALSDQGAHYTLVHSLTTWDATVPTSLGLYARGTWTVAIIARADLDPAAFSFTNFQEGKWTATFIPHLYALDGKPDACPVALDAKGACRMPWPRGWVSADVFYRDKQFRIVGAHLDSASALLEIPQGIELLNGPANTSLPVIVAADLNCDCSNPNDPMYPTCVNFTKAGFTDAWAVANPSDVGYTKYFPVLSQRSDYAMVRGRFKVQAVFIVGDQASDKTPSGLWPSDHAGVVARLQLPGED